MPLERCTKFVWWCVLLPQIFRKEKKEAYIATLESKLRAEAVPLPSRSGPSSFNRVESCSYTFLSFKFRGHTSRTYCKLTFFPLSQFGSRCGHGIFAGLGTGYLPSRQRFLPPCPIPRRPALFLTTAFNRNHPHCRNAHSTKDAHARIILW